MGKKRLDQLLIEHGHATDRKQAAALALSGVVLVDGRREDKPGTRIDGQAEIRLTAGSRRYVSRGGLKLESALEAFGLNVSDFVCMDLGASTGGFTDCLLQYGARKVYAFDVGKGQLDWSLRQNPQVMVRDGFNVRFLTPSSVDDEIDLVTVDLSFISLSRVLPALKAFSRARFLLLVKPQFEAERREVARGGVIPTEAKRLEILERVKQLASRQGFRILGHTASPILGQKGNREYFLLLENATI